MENVNALDATSHGAGNGGSGGPSFRPVGRADTRLIEKALEKGWPIPDEYRQHIVNRQMHIAVDPSISPRQATSAARCLVSMDGQNMERMFKLLDKVVPDQHEHHHAADVRQLAEELRADPDYADFQRRRACERDTDAGLVCQIGNNGDSRAVDDGSPHGVSRPGADGDCNGDE